LNTDLKQSHISLCSGAIYSFNIAMNFRIMHFL